MPKSYNSDVLNRFINARAHLGKLLSLYSQEIATRIIHILQKRDGIKAAEIRKEIGMNVQSFVVSRVLGNLRDEGILKCAEGTYFLKDDFTYSLLAKTKLPACYPQKDGIPVRVRDTARVFSTLFFDQINNILIHMLLQEDRPFHEILRTFTNNHGYVSANTLRYHLDKTITFCDGELPLFELANGKYRISDNIRKLNDIFDEFLEEYDEDMNTRVERLLNSKLLSLADRDIEIVSPTDNMRKIVHILTYTKYALVLSSGPEGIITMGNLMNIIGRGVFEDMRFSDMTARDLMRPITAAEILPPDMTLRKLFEKHKRLKNNHYVVDEDGSYAILDVYSLVRKLPYI